MGEAYIVVEITNVRNPEGVKQYQTMARKQLAKRNGVTIARGGQTISGAPHGPLLIMKWPSAEEFQEWHDSPEYQPLKVMREAAADFRITIVPAL